MKETRVLFTPQMFSAGRRLIKTNTRRVMSSQPPHDCGRIEVGYYHPIAYDRHGEMYPGDEVYGAYSDCGEWGLKSPYGAPGDIILPATTWAVPAEYDHLRPTELDPDVVGDWFWLAGAADKPEWAGKSRPGRFLPKSFWHKLDRWTITEVRAERLHDISEADAFAEGIQGGDWMGDPVGTFAELWDSINAHRYPWAGNWWVWVYKFEVTAVPPVFHQIND